MELMYITTKGLEYFAQTAKGKILHFTKGKFGDGAYTGETPVTAMTELINPLGEMPISKQITNGTLVTITTQFSNKVDGKILNAFNLKEIGLYAELYNEDGTADTANPETLVAYAYAQGADVGDRIEGVLTEFSFNWNCTISDTSNVTVELGSMVYVTQDEFNEAIKDVEEKAENFIVHVSTGGDTITANKTYDEISEAVNSKKGVFALIQGSLEEDCYIPMTSYDENGGVITFGKTLGKQHYGLTLLGSVNKWYYTEIEFAQKSTTLTGYGITDSYTKDEVDASLEEKANKSDIPTQTEVVDSLTSTDTTKALSANMGNQLSTMYDGVREDLASKVENVEEHGLIKIQDNEGSATVTLMSSLSDGEVGEYDTKDVEIPKLDRMLTVEDALSTLQTRITYSTDDLTAGESPLADGTIYFVYE